MPANTIRLALLSSAAVLTSVSAPTAWAQVSSPEIEQRDSIGEIVVSARRRVESLQDTPIAVTAVSSETLEQRGIENFVDISRITPNLKVTATPGGMGAAAVAMRGISYADNIIGNDAPFGFYIDGVPYGRISTAAMDIVEPDSVQVLRGPQGTLFGRNTTGGAIVIETHTPSDDFGGVVRVGYGSFDAIQYRARIDTGLIGGSNIKASFAYQRRQRDGIQDNVGIPDRLDPGSEESDAYWGKIQGEWGNFQATVSADYTKMGGVPPMIQLVAGTPAFLEFLENSPNYGGNTIPVTDEPLFRIENYADPIPQRIIQKGVQLTLEYALNDNLTAKGIGALRAYSRDDTNNYGASDIRGPTAGGIVSWPGWYGFNERFQNQKQKTLEIQLLGNYQQFNFVLGGFYFDEDARDFGTTRLPFVLNPDLALDSVTYRDYSVRSKSKAAFAQVDWRPEFLGGDVEFTGGIRYTDDSRDFSQVTPIVRTLDLKGDNWSYMVGANYKFSDDLMAYVKYSTGYRAGGLNARTTSPTISPVFAPEKIKAWEAGFKLEGFDNRVRLNVAAFFNKYNNLQVTQFAPPGGGGGGGNINVNANAEYKGFEIEAIVIPVNGLTLSGSFGYVDMKYKRYPRALGTGGALLPGCSPINNSAGVAVLQDCANVTLFQNVPDTQWDINATYEFPMQSYGRPSLTVNYSWTGSTDGVYVRSASAFPYILDNDSYGLLGARFAISDMPINDDLNATFALFGRNLTDRRYGVGSIDFSYAGTKNFPDRRTMGVELKLDF